MANLVANSDTENLPYLRGFRKYRYRSDPHTGVPALLWKSLDIAISDPKKSVNCSTRQTELLQKWPGQFVRSAGALFIIVPAQPYGRTVRTKIRLCLTKFRVPMGRKKNIRWAFMNKISITAVYLLPKST